MLIQQSDLVADGAVKGVVDQEELHHSLSSFSREVGVGVHLPPLKIGTLSTSNVFTSVFFTHIHDRHSTGRHWLGRLLHLNKAHPENQEVKTQEPNEA